MPRRNLTLLLVATVISLACYARASRNRYAETFARTMNIVTSQYVDEVEPRVLFEGGMKGMMDQLDIYSGYTPPEEYQQFRQQLDGEFPGIGVMLDPDESSPLRVLVPLPGSPAAKAGIQAGDIIAEVEGVPTADIDREAARNKIKGPAGTVVRLGIRRGELPHLIQLDVPRETISLESVQGDARRADGSWVFHLLDHPRLGYIRINTFAERTADDFRRALDTFRQPGQEIDGLILDLRGNVGGLLKTAVETCDMLLDDGLIVSTRGRGGVEREAFSASRGTEIPSDLPLVVLIDRNAASASEIVAGCLQDHHRAVTIGERTWGKGTVQVIETLEGGKSAIRLTIATYWRPSGKDIHKRRDAKESDDWGVRPDPEMEVILPTQLRERWLLARRQRDVTPIDELQSLPRAAPQSPDSEPTSGAAAAPPDGPPAPVPDAGEDDPLPAANQRPIDPHYVDPQLQKAIDYLRDKIKDAASAPRAA